MPRTIFIGDIHGCRLELAELLALLQPHPGEDRVIFVGDLVDKGPDSIGVLRDVQRFLRTVPGSVCVAGNHEEKALRFYKNAKLPKLIDGREDRRWAENATDEDWAFIESMPLTWYDPTMNIRVVHGGIFPRLLTKHPDAFDRIPATDWHKGGGKLMNRARRILRVRYVGGDHRTDGVKGIIPPGEMLELGTNEPGDPFWADTYDGSQGFVVYGHSPWLSGTPKKSPHAMGIDTACVFGANLTAMVVEADPSEPGGWSFHWVPVAARERYAQPLEED